MGLTPVLGDNSSLIVFELFQLNAGANCDTETLALGFLVIDKAYL